MCPDANWDETLLEGLSSRIADRFGIKIPKNRWSALHKALRRAGLDAGEQRPERYGRCLLDRNDHDELLQLASRVAVGETYFFRDQAMLSTLEQRILAPLIKARRDGSRRLRLMSAGCSSGEEAYTLAIMVRGLLGDTAGWDITILGTDVNRKSLEKARSGLYTAWSFRKGGVPPSRRYFLQESDRHWRILPELRSMVTFVHLNLATDTYPTLKTGTVDMDLVICRNVLMYFTPEAADAATRRLRDCLAPGGFLILGANEDVHQPGLEKTGHVGILVRSGQAMIPAIKAHPALVPNPDRESEWRPDWNPAAKPELEPKPAPVLPPGDVLPQPEVLADLRPDPVPVDPKQQDTNARADSALEHYRAGRYDQAAGQAEVLAKDAMSAGNEHWVRAVYVLVLSLANLGRHDQADQAACQAIALDKLNPELRYLRASILLESGQDRLPQAREELRRTLYLDEGFALAHFLLGELARMEGEPGVARKHFTNARQIAEKLPKDAVLAGSEGMNAGSLASLLDTLVAQGGTP